MRDYTSIDRNRYQIVNIFRSKRFDIDRLDLDIVRGEDVPDMARGFRIVDHETDDIHLVNGPDADYLIFSLAHIHCVNDGEYMYKFDQYLIRAIETDVYLITKQDPEALVELTLLH